MTKSVFTCSILVLLLVAIQGCSHRRGYSRSCSTIADQYDRCVCERQPHTGLSIFAVALGAAAQGMSGRTGKSDAQINLERQMDRIHDLCLLEASRQRTTSTQHRSSASYSPSNQRHELCTLLNGARVIASDGSYLGTITDSYHSDSIFNEHGGFGSEFNANSVWNEFGTYGSEFSSASAFNEFSSTPPMIVKGQTKVGYLTKNSVISTAIDPDVLKAACGN